MFRRAGSILSSFSLIAAAAAALQPQSQNLEFQALQAHFDGVIAARHAALFRNISSLPAWESRKRQVRQELTRMLWHDRVWPAAPPLARITDRVEHAAYRIENLVLETAPQLYATANLYLPRAGNGPFPIVLYQCGHASKDQFSHHGAWFAAHGIAALVMDNIEMGELEFTHHGVYSNSWFHWYSRGFSPLAVELFNARRALDYIATRSDLDPARIGATGRSGGGMTTFFLAALDERVKAAAPVSGAISTTGWVRHRLTRAHCDCQYPINSSALLYSEIGALIAPRVQLLVNADADPGFPMDAFDELVAKMREVYRLYNAESALRKAVAPGAHSDSEAIRLPVFSFFLKEFLNLDTPLSSEGPVERPQPESLVCFRDGLPLNERLTRVDEEFLPQSRIPNLADLVPVLRNEVFGYFTHDVVPLDPMWAEPVIVRGRSVQKVTFNSFQGLRVRASYSRPSGSASRLPAVLVVDDRKGIRVWGNEQPLEQNQWGSRAALIVETLDRGTRALEQNLRSFSDDDALHHMKRQAMIAGTTLESMQVYEILRSLELLRTLPDVDPLRITVTGKFDAGVNGLYAALLDGNVERVILGSPPVSHRSGPHYLGVLKYTDIPDVIHLMGKKVRLYGDVAEPVRERSTVCESLFDCLK